MLHCNTECQWTGNKKLKVNSFPFVCVIHFKTLMYSLILTITIKINLKAVWKLFYILIRLDRDDFLPIVKNVPTSYYNMYL